MVSGREIAACKGAIVIEQAIRAILTHVPLILCVSALVLAWTTRRNATSQAEHYLGWTLLLAIGADCLWAGLYHVLAPHTAAAFIGWQVSPFQFEIGVADIAIGLVAMVSFWRSLDFKAAVVGYAVVFYAGVVYGHIHEAITANNFAPGNVGILLALSIVRPVVVVALLWAARRRVPAMA